MDKSGKYWGSTRTVFQKNGVEVHHLEVVPQGYCSEHLHSHKFNRFIVLSGRLVVFTWASGEDLPPDEVILQPFDELTVPPGLIHKFVTRDLACTLLEIYWTEMDPGDIVRRSIGGGAYTQERKKRR